MKKLAKEGLEKQMIALLSEKILNDLKWKGKRKTYLFRWNGSNARIIIEVSDVYKLVKTSVKKSIIKKFKN